MNERELIEAAARAICVERWSGRDDAWPSYQGQARAVVAALRQALKHEVVERCASVCDRLGQELQTNSPFDREAKATTSVNEAVGAQKCAQAIRALSPLSRSPEGAAIRRETGGGFASSRRANGVDGQSSNWFTKLRQNADRFGRRVAYRLPRRGRGLSG